MESLSRVFHRKNHRSFSAYDDVFSGGGGGAVGAPTARIEDYKEIFRGSSSSIPVLDLSALDGAAEVAEVRGRSKKLDYSKIFGGLRGDDVGDSYEDVFAKRTPTKTTTFSDRSTSPGCQKDEDYQSGKPNKSPEVVKQYNTFYNRTSRISKDGENGTTHVAQINAVPGFTCFIDENVQKTVGDKLGPLPKDKIRTTQRVSSELNKQKPTDGTGNLRGQSNCDKFYSVDRNVDTNGSSFKTHSPKLSSPTRVPASSTSERKRSGELNSKIPKSGAPEAGHGDCSPTFSDEEPNVDSAAAVSAAALRKAVREAEASIRLAKEIMERSKNGFQRFPKPRSKEGVDMKKKKVEKASIQANKTETVSPKLKEIERTGIGNEGVRETDGAKSNSTDNSQVHITKLERKKVRRSGKLIPGFTQSEEKCVVENVSGEGNVELDIFVPKDNQKKENLDLKHLSGAASGNVKEDKLENSADSEAPEQFSELMKAQNQRPSNFGLGHKNGNNYVPSVSSGSGRANGDKLELSADSNVENQRTAKFDVGQENGKNSRPSVHRVSGEAKEAQSENQRTANLELEHTNGSNIMPSFLNLFGKIKEKLESSFDSIALGQFPEFMKTDNQKTVTSGLEHTNDSNIGLSVPNLSEKVNEKLETSSDSVALGQFPELVKADNHTTATLESDPTINLSEEVNEKLKTSADSEALGQFPELVKTEERTDTFELDPANNLFEEVNEKLETSDGSEAIRKFPELVKIEERTETQELDHANGNYIRVSVPNLSEEVNKKLEMSDDYVVGQFPELVKTDTLKLDHTIGSNIKPSVPNLSEEVNEKFETSDDSEALRRFPELVKTDNERTETLESDLSSGSNIRQDVRNLPEKVNKEKLEVSEPVKTDDQITAISELKDRHGSNISVSMDNLIQRSMEGELESSVDTMKEPEQIPEFVKTDNQRTEHLDLEQTNGSITEPSVHLISDKMNNKSEASADTVPDLECTNSSNVTPSVHNVPTEVNENKFEPSADSHALEEFPELVKTDNSSTATSEFVKTDNQRTEPLDLEQTNASITEPSVHLISDKVNNKSEASADTVPDLECTNSSNVTPSVHNVPTEVNENKLEPSADSHALEEFTELVKTDNSSTATSELRQKAGSNMMPPPVHTNGCSDMENEADRGNLELLERHNKEIHRKRKQWKDIEGNPSDIKIAEEGGESVHVTIPKEVNEREERTFEPFEGHNKEIYRKRRQWKDVEIKPSDIKIADGGEEYVHGHEKRERKTDILDNKDVGEKQEASSSEESYAKEDKTQDREKNVSFESSGVLPNRGEKVYEAQKSTQECSKVTESTMSLNGVHEDEESVKHMCKQSENEKIEESSDEERRQNDDMEREMVTSAAWKEDRSEHLGDISSEGSERMSDASQSSFDYKEDFDFDEEVGETSEVFQSCESKANRSIEETIEHEVAITEDTYSHHLDDFPETVGSNDEDAADIVRNDSELANTVSAGINDPEQMQKEAAQPPNELKEEEKVSGTDEVEEKTANESVHKAVKDDETSKRERERERNRIVVERAIREARERAFAEARERAERAAVEKATAEARERVMAEARQKFEKTNSATKSSTERVSLHAKLRSERAAVERAHAEARERALEKALSQKSNSNTPSKQEANNGETAERRNARLERTQRTMERAAKALAEKNMRDLRAQREQAERHRLAETLDAEIKRWSSGKTGNLRALLSTLQYILGPDSGWQPVSLTEIVTTSAVKKAYRKATLHVHPDKLQQRGASIQQKYICEKVFDLLKAAWNKFNSEER